MGAERGDGLTAASELDGPLLAFSDDPRGPAACIFAAGRVVASASGSRAVEQCFEDAGSIAPTAVVIADQPVSALAAAVVGHARAGIARHGRLAEDLRLAGARAVGTRRHVARALRRAEVPVPAMWFVERHLALAAAAYYRSTSPAAAVLAVDPGRWPGAIVAHGRGRRLHVIAQRRDVVAVGSDALRGEPFEAMVSTARRLTGEQQVIVTGIAAVPRSFGAHDPGEGLVEVPVPPDRAGSTAAVGAALWAAHELLGMPRSSSPLDAGRELH